MNKLFLACIHVLLGGAVSTLAADHHQEHGGFWMELISLFSGVSQSRSHWPDSGGDGLDQKHEFLFSEWMVNFEKEYETPNEMGMRKRIWIDNHVLIEKHNNQIPPPSYSLGHNQFSDLTLEEFQALNKLGKYGRGGILSPPAALSSVTKTLEGTSTERRGLVDLPESVDWRAKGAVTPVKNQGMCGSCWAFSAIGSIEGAHFLDTGELVSLSEQQLVDCDKLDLGCSGGLMDNAFLFDEDSHGICSEEDYPYAGHKHWLRGCEEKRGLCQDVQHTRVKSFVDVGNETNSLLMEALTLQPVSVGVEASQVGWQFYRGGVFNKECGIQCDHGVLAVGYGTDQETGEEYWLVKNSWGASWGDGGYIKLARINEDAGGQCGILTFASRPLLRDDE